MFFISHHGKKTYGVTLSKCIEKNIGGNTRDAGSQSEWGVLRESLYNDVIINAAQHPLFTETRLRVTLHSGLRSDKHSTGV